MYLSIVTIRLGYNEFLLMDEFEDALAALLNSEKYPELKNTLNRTITIATGKLAYPTIQSFAKRLEDNNKKIFFLLCCKPF